MVTWLRARQRGVTLPRRDAGNPSGVNVFNAMEVNRVAGAFMWNVFDNECHEAEGRYLSR